MEKPVYLNDIDKYFLMGKEGEIYEEAVGTLEKILIEKALERTGGSQLSAAEMLGINRNTMRSKIRKLGIIVERFKR